MRKPKQIFVNATDLHKQGCIYNIIKNDLNHRYIDN